MKVPGIVGLSCALVPLASPGAWPSDDGFAVRSVVPPAAGGVALHWAVRGARQRLEREECQRVLSDFADASGRALQENLDALGHEVAAYLGLILFADGSNRSRCQRSDVMAFTTPGVRVVYVCGPRLKGLVERDPARAQAIIIHEALHTLGLGEDPPSSAEITARVLERCRQ
jgi:hypothetical protein